MEPISDEIKASKIDEKRVNKGGLQSFLKAFFGLGGTGTIAFSLYLLNHFTASSTCSDISNEIFKSTCSIIVEYKNDEARKANQDKVNTYQAEMDKLLKEGLDKSKSDDQIFKTARHKTASIIPLLDPASQRSVFNYLENSNLNTLPGENGILFKAQMSGSQLIKADLRKFKLVKADLTGAKLMGADLTEADLTGAKLIGADLTGAKLIGANLTKADFSKATLRDVKFDDADLTKTDFSAATFKNVKLDNAILYKTSFGKFHNERKGKYYWWYESNTTFEEPTAKQSFELSLVCDVVLATRSEFKMTEQETYADEDYLDKKRDCEGLPERLVSKYPDKFKDIEAAKAYVNPKLPSK